MKTNTKYLYILIIILTFLLAWVLIRENYPERVFNKIKHPAPAEKITYWLNRNELFETLPADSNSIIFLGTSLTEQFELGELFQNLDLKNRGITGDNTKGALLRLGTVWRAHPKKIFIELGINDILGSTAADTILYNYEHILDTLQQKSPRTEIYLQSIFPVTVGESTGKRFNVKAFNQHINSLNIKLNRLAQSKKIKYISLAKAFSVNGELDSTLTFDGVHLNGKAYLLWRDILKPYVEERKLP